MSFCLSVRDRGWISVSLKFWTILRDWMLVWIPCLPHTICTKSLKWCDHLQSVSNFLALSHWARHVFVCSNDNNALKWKKVKILGISLLQNHSHTVSWFKLKAWWSYTYWYLEGVTPPCIEIDFTPPSFYTSALRYLLSLCPFILSYCLYNVLWQHAQIHMLQ